MSDKIKEMLEEIEEMKIKLGEEIAKQEEHISYEIKNGYNRFEKHAKKVAYEHDHYVKYFEYGDGDAYQVKLKALRGKSEEKEA